jgi:hypothetical protein
LTFAAYSNPPKNHESICKIKTPLFIPPKDAPQSRSDNCAIGSPRNKSFNALKTMIDSTILSIYFLYYFACLIISRIFFIDFIFESSCKPGFAYVPFLILIPSNLVLAWIIYVIRAKEKRSSNLSVRRWITIVTALEIVLLGLLIGLIFGWLYHIAEYERLRTYGSMIDKRSGIVNGLLYAFTILIPPCFVTSLLIIFRLKKTDNISSKTTISIINYCILTATLTSITLMIHFTQIGHPALDFSSRAPEEAMDYCSPRSIWWIMEVITHWISGFMRNII